MKLMKAMMSSLEKLDNKVDGLLGGQVGWKEVGKMEVGIDRKKVRKLEVEEEKEEEQQAVKLTLEEAAEGSLMVKGKVDGWLGDRGFGLLKVKGKVVFFHSARVVGKEWLQVD